MGTKSCNRESKSCSTKYGIFYQFMYTRDSCSARAGNAGGTVGLTSLPNRHAIGSERVGGGTIGSERAGGGTDAVHAYSGGLDGQLKTFDLNTNTESVVGSHDAPIRCVEFCPEVNTIITGSWDSNIKLWDPRGPREAGTFQQPNKVWQGGRDDNHKLM
ncbi:Mitotic checkpoint protein BUB3 [Portunus trituberculatus]|uniref:Mitotic checkpoint protein BUB3 n=1 Tax=Portunus trituberculatus TaxID=210409 RepID=A0A5B7FM41_PORTR|nr:Mitotic checkpoint protein BUB3 [Portunus trituberculatus]